MIISRTPLKLPLSGGLSDLRDFYKLFGGITISTSINKYIYVKVKYSSKYFYIKNLNKLNKYLNFENISNEYIKKTIEYAGFMHKPLNIEIKTDLNSSSGLGSSSCIIVGLLNALYHLKGIKINKEKLAKDASKIEIEVLKKPVGDQDSYICSYGGLRLIKYHRNKISIYNNLLKPEILKKFNQNLMLFETGFRNKTEESLSILKSNINNNFNKIQQIKKNSLNMFYFLIQDKINEAGKCIEIHQILKEKLPGKFKSIKTNEIKKRVKKYNSYFQIPGGKIGSYLLIYSEKNFQNKIRTEFSELKEIPFEFEFEGSKII